jgi:phosphotransacetylase
VITRLDQLAGFSPHPNPQRVAVLCPRTVPCLRAAAIAQERGAVDCTFVGDGSQIGLLADRAELDLQRYALIDEPDPEGAIQRVLLLCRSEEIDVLVNGGAPLRLLLPAILDRAEGLRTGNLLSGVSVIELDTFEGLLLLSDGLLVVSPGLEERIQIVRNAVQVAHVLGIERPRVAMLAAAETVDPGSPVSVDAAQITVMAARNQIADAYVDGPLGFDNAVSLRAAEIKGIAGDVSGRANVLIAPDLESANLLLRTLTYLCRGRAIHIIVGGIVPLLLPSPGDNAQLQTLAIALGVRLGQEEVLREA